jgi:hypothetical protein
MTCYISLGSDCSVSYQLRLLGLQVYGSMPFDWMRIDRLESVCKILEEQFTCFLDINKYDIKSQSNDTFDKFTELGDKDKKSTKSMNKMVHKIYKFTLPHEFNNDQLDILEFQNKYSRRIAKFINTCQNESIMKIFIRLGNNNEKEKIDKLEEQLVHCGYKNYKIKFINMDDYKNLIPLDILFNWHRDYIPWSYELFNK